MKKRILAILLAAVMVMATVPAVFAEDTPTSGKCGESVTWSYDEGTKTLTISGTGPMTDYASDSFDEEDYDYQFAPWPRRIDSLIIEPGVTSIGKAAFSGLNMTGNVTIPEGVTRIGKDAFNGCDMAGVSIPSSVTDIGTDAFVDCLNLVSIDVDGANQNYTSVNGVLFSKDMTTLYQCPGGKSGTYQIPSGVTSIGEKAFCVCIELDSVTIPESVTSIGNWAFDECFSLTSVTIPKSVTSIGYSAFFECESLKDVYYGGSEEQWAKIDIDNDRGYNDYLLNAAIHYNSASADPGPGPVVPDTPTFTDVKPGAYYADAVAWAVENKVTTGATTTTFNPGGNCTRAQIVTFLWRAYGSQEPKSMVSPFTDVTDTTSPYYKAILWAVENDITTGATETTFNPGGACTRGQAVTFLWRAADKPSASGGSAFTDVAGGAFYADAVKWAVENKITDGKTPTTFDPNGTCTRGQIVTFLYRDLAK